MLSPAQYVERYEEHSGLPVDPGALRFWRVFSLVKLAAIFRTGARASVLRPTLVLMGRAIPWLEEEIAVLLREALAERPA
jgi:hypothetical protein